MSQVIGLHSTVKQADNLFSCVLDGETALMSLTSGHYYGLDPIGSHIWSLIEPGRVVAEVCELLLEEYDVESAQCEHHVLAFLNELARNNLVAVVDEPAR